MFKLIIPLLILIVVCLFTGTVGLKLLGFITLCAGVGVLFFLLLRFFAQKFPKIFNKLNTRKEKKSH